MPMLPPTQSFRAAWLVVLACAQSIHGVSVDGTCNSSMTSSATLLQHKSSVQRDTFLIEIQGSCDPVESWPNVDNGVTCPPCGALVLTEPYQGRCDKYCQSIPGHTCVAAAEERDETCQVLENKRCDEEITGTSDMLCTCQRSQAVSCAAFGSWPDVDGGVTCFDCTALVLTGPYGGRCDRYCESIPGHTCVAAAEELGETCQVLESKRCDEEIKDTSDMLCTCKLGHTGGSGPTTPAPRPPAGAAKFTVVSYNLYWWNAFGQNPWKGTQITNNIRSLNPDVLGVQECDDPSLIQSRTEYLPASKFAGAQGVLVRPGLFTVGEKGSRDIRAAGKWGARHVTWVQLTHRQSGRTFWHFNTHWCVHNGRGRTCSADKRYFGAKNMLQVIQERAGGAPVVITGDFNAGQGEPGPRHFLQNGFAMAKWNWVDGVLYSAAHWQMRSARTGEKAGSDHSPVIAELELN